MTILTTSRYTKIILLREKSEVTEKIIEFIALMKNQIEFKPKKFNSYRGGEYVNAVLFR